VLEDVGDSNFRAKDHLYMDGSAVFNFVQTEVPGMIDDLLKEAGTDKDSVDVFLCHQPNRFMLQKLADKMKVPYAKMPMNVVEHFGNSGGATIPMAIALNLAQETKGRYIRACFAGFGAGMTWSSMLMRLGKLEFCEIVDYK
jgi:3-oxoacyl-[acyl-carrier-protein] synthase-3